MVNLWLPNDIFAVANGEFTVRCKILVRFVCGSRISTGFIICFPISFYHLFYQKVRSILIFLLLASSRKFICENIFNLCRVIAVDCSNAYYPQDTMKIINLQYCFHLILSQICSLNTPRVLFMRNIFYLCSVAAIVFVCATLHINR